MTDLRVLVVADDPLARAGLAALLAGHPSYAPAGQIAADGLSLALESLRPDVLLWDLGWEPSESLEYLAEAQAASPPILVLVPSPSHAREAWAAGARGLLPRDAPAASIRAALLAVSLGLSVLDPAFSPVPPDQGQGMAPLSVDLTPRELEVLRLLAEGLPNKAIAQRLGVSDHTVKFHVNSLFNKLGVQSRTEAVVRATRLGLVLL